MSDGAGGSDMGLGLALFFGVVAVLGASGMLVMHDQQVFAAAGFAIAVLAGSLSVASLHAYGVRSA